MSKKEKLFDILGRCDKKSEWEVVEEDVKESNLSYLISEYKLTYSSSWKWKVREHSNYNMELGKCPYCDSDNLEYGNSKVDDYGYVYEVTCRKCNKEFEENYEMKYSGKSVIENGNLKVIPL